MGVDLTERLYLLPPEQFDAASDALQSGEPEEAYDALELLFATNPDPAAFEGSQHLVYMGWLIELYGDGESEALTAFDHLDEFSFRSVPPDEVASHASSISGLLRRFEASPEMLLPRIHGALKSLHQSSLKTTPKTPPGGGSFMHQKMVELLERTERAARDFAMTGEDVRSLLEFARTKEPATDDGGAAMRAFVDQHAPGSNLLYALIDSLGYLDGLRAPYAKAEDASLGIIHLTIRM